MKQQQDIQNSKQDDKQDNNKQVRENYRVLNLEILGTPEPKQSFRFSAGRRKDGTVYVNKFQSAKVKDNEQRMAWIIKSQLPPDFKIHEGMIQVRILFAFPIIKTMKAYDLKKLEEGITVYKTTKPDLDNLEKPLFDSMQGIIYKNDSQIASKYSEKIYSHLPRIEVSMKLITP